MNAGVASIQLSWEPVGTYSRDEHRKLEHLFNTIPRCAEPDCSLLICPDSIIKGGELQWPVLVELLDDRLEKTKVSGHAEGAVTADDRQKIDGRWTWNGKLHESGRHLLLQKKSWTFESKDNLLQGRVLATYQWRDALPLEPSTSGGREQRSA